MRKRGSTRPLGTSRYSSNFEDRVSTSLWVTPMVISPVCEPFFSEGGSSARARGAAVSSRAATVAQLFFISYLPRYGPEGALPPWTFWWQFLQACSTARLLMLGPPAVL